MGDHAFAQNILCRDATFLPMQGFVSAASEYGSSSQQVEAGGDVWSLRPIPM